MFPYTHICLLFTFLTLINAAVIPGTRISNEYAWVDLLKRTFFSSEIPNVQLEKRAPSPAYQKAINDGATFVAKFRSGPSPGEDTRFHIKDVTQTIFETNQLFDNWGWTDPGSGDNNPRPDLQSALSANGLTGMFTFYCSTHE